MAAFIREVVDLLADDVEQSGRYARSHVGVFLKTCYEQDGTPKTSLARLTHETVRGRPCVRLTQAPTSDGGYDSYVVFSQRAAAIECAVRPIEELCARQHVCSVCVRVGPVQSTDCVEDALTLVGTGADGFVAADVAAVREALSGALDEAYSRARGAVR